MAEGATRARRSGARHAAEREGRRLALRAIFEADFGARTPNAALERALADAPEGAPGGAEAGSIVAAVVRHRDEIDARIERLAPVYPVVGLARIDRALLRSAMGEVLHCPATPVRVAISEWVELARTYSGEPARRLLNGVLGRVATEMADTAREP
ncbi:MAG: transcription antitermination factor NusB [Gaiellales bacterium]